MKYIISANYLDRSSVNRWLVRREDQTPQEATRCATVKAVNATFEVAGSVESALGCSSVAVTNEEPTFTVAEVQVTIEALPAFDPASLPAGHEWSNPDEVEASDVPPGYRFAVKAEIDRKQHEGSKYWTHVSKFEFNGGEPEGANHTPGDTIIVPIATPFPPAPAPAPAPEEVTIRYDHGSFMHGDSYLEEVKALNLHADGSITALL